MFFGVFWVLFCDSQIIMNIKLKTPIFQDIDVWLVVEQKQREYIFDRQIENTK